MAKRNLLTACMLMFATPVMAQNLYGDWAKTVAMCNKQSDAAGDWLSVSQKGIKGYEFTCRFLKVTADRQSLNAYTQCGYDDTDVIFFDNFSLSATVNTLTIKSNNFEQTYVRCNRR